MLSVFTEMPGKTAPTQANILPPTFQASCPPPQRIGDFGPRKGPAYGIREFAAPCGYRGESGSAFAGLNANTPFYHLTLALAILAASS
jgi:hypothetical protein